jgi:hypothetical protein
MITVDVDSAVSMMLTMKWQASVTVHGQATGGLYGVRTTAARPWFQATEVAQF